MDDAEIPIDIHYNKLSDWLISRRHCQHDWQKGALDVREKINVALQDMPPVEEITKLLQGTYINYFHCLCIVELLKATDAGKRNIFGQYSSQHMKEWLEIIKLYDKDNIYLAEASQLLTRNVNYEIPSLKRQIAKCQQTQKDSERKQHEYTSNATELKQKFAHTCKDMGIEGKRVKSELLELAKDLPKVYETIGKAAANLKPAIAYYQDFVQFTIGREETCVPMLSYLAEHGNVTTYEWRTGLAPSSVEEMNLELDGGEEKIESELEGEAEINWGSVDEELADGVAEIDWETTGEGDGIDWGGELEIQVVDDSAIDVAKDEGVARGTDALTLLDNTETRNQIMNDMQELSSFLENRGNELKDSTVLANNQFQTAPTSLQVDAGQVSAMLAEVHGIVGQVAPKHMQEIILIRSSPRYVNNLADKLNRMLEMAEKLQSRCRLMIQQATDAAEEEKTIYPKLQLIKLRTTELQAQIAEEISKKYKGRRVNIMGEINKL